MVETAIDREMDRILAEALPAERPTLMARAWCAEAVRAIDALDAMERPYARYLGAGLGKEGKAATAARAAVRKAVTVLLNKYASSEAERELCRQYLKDLRSKAPRSRDLRNALSGSQS